MALIVARILLVCSSEVFILKLSIIPLSSSSSVRMIAASMSIMAANREKSFIICGIASSIETARAG